jgi:hypothetical protein
MIKLMKIHSKLVISTLAIIILVCIVLLAKGYLHFEYQDDKTKIGVTIRPYTDNLEAVPEKTYTDKI